MEWQALLKMTNPLDEIFKPEEIRTLSEEEQRIFQLSLIPYFWEERETNYRFALGVHRTSEIYINT